MPFPAPAAVRAGRRREKFFAFIIPQPARLCYTAGMIRRDDLQYGGLVLFQDDALPRFDADAVHLAHFLRLRAGERVVDLGCGTGVLCVLGQAYTGAAFTGVDVEPRLTALAARSAAQNGQDIAFLTLDVRDAPARLGHGAFDAAVCNPPYFTAGPVSADPARAAARHDAGGTFEAMLHAAFLLLKNGGRLFLCYHAAGLAAAMTALHAHRLEAKRLRLVAAGPDRPPRLALIEAKKDGGAGLFVEPVLFERELDRNSPKMRILPPKQRP